METQGVELEQRSVAATSRRWWRLVLPAVLIAMALSLGGWRLWEVGRYQRALAQINQQIAAGRHGLAVRNLVSLLARKPDSDEAIYLLGACERARGRPQEADEAWARVPPDSPFWGQAVQRRTELKIERGLLGDAEQLVIVAQKNAPRYGSLLNALLASIFGQQGRFLEAGRLIEAEWEQLNQIGEGASEKAVNLVRLHMDLKRKLAPQEPTRAYLEQASRLAPEDDRVWLGRADMAIRDGSFDVAARLLERCLRRRPDDVAVWCARLSWAQATNQLAALRQVLEHVPADESTPAQTHKLAAWIARQQGDVESEQRALERLIVADPADLRAVTRLAEMAERAGQPGRAAELRERKKEIERLQTRYQKLYDRNQPIRDAVELARLATGLGLDFEAKAFLRIAVADDPGQTDLRDELRRRSQPRAPDPRPGRTLAQVLASEEEFPGRCSIRAQLIDQVHDHGFFASDPTRRTIPRPNSRSLRQNMRTMPIEAPTIEARGNIASGPR